MPYDTPLFNLGAVVEETGVSGHTLRAWERRYGLPQPARSEGGHRMYSKRDIDIIKWLLARLDEGLTISRAVAYWRRLSAAGQAPLAAPPSSEAAASLSGGTIADYRRSWISACLDFDETRAQSVIREAFAMFGPEPVALDVLESGVAQIGELWARQEASVQQEHFATELAMRHLETVLAVTPPPHRASLLVACPPGEMHVLSLLTVSLLLRRRGWNVIHLGANVPLTRLEEVIAAKHPRLVVSAAQTLPAAASLVDMAELLASHDVALAYGGWVFNYIPALRQRVPGRFLSETTREAPDVIEDLLSGVPAPAVIDPIPQRARSLHRYRERLPLIEAQAWRELAQRDMIPEHLADGIEPLPEHISAALFLCMPESLPECLRWVKDLLSCCGMSSDFVDEYLVAYLSAARTYLDDAGKSVLEWLSSAVEATLVPTDSEESTREETANRERS